MKRAWMHDLCSPSRPEIAQPFSVEFDGRTWDAAANGPAILLLESDTPSFERGGPDLSAARPGLLIAREAPRAVSIDALRDWAWTPERVECDECGCGYRPMSEGRLFERLLDRRLLYRFLPPVSSVTVRGRLFGRLLDRRLLYRFLPPVSSVTVRVHVGEPLASTLIEGAGWRLYLMPVREDDETEVVPSFDQEEASCKPS